MNYSRRPHRTKYKSMFALIFDCSSISFFFFLLNVLFVYYSLSLIVMDSHKCFYVRAQYASSTFIAYVNVLNIYSVVDYIHMTNLIHYAMVSLTPGYIFRISGEPPCILYIKGKAILRVRFGRNTYTRALILKDLYETTVHRATAWSCEPVHIQS